MWLHYALYFLNHSSVVICVINDWHVRGERLIYLGIRCWVLYDYESMTQVCGSRFADPKCKLLKTHNMLKRIILVSKQTHHGNI